MLTFTIWVPPTSGAALGHGDHVIDDAGGDVDPGRVDAVPEFHSVVDLVHHDPARGLEEIDGDYAAADGPRPPHPHLVQLGRDGAVGRDAAARRVRPPAGLRA